ncbi:MAG TPA: ABC transporter ATP-binding protein [Chthoniobacteraceae bacterium]|jgi:ABC-2 type transport system ATP-binding protein
MIEVESLSKYYEDFPAVADLSFTVSSGEVLGLVGPNGAGKTTTLRCLAGIIPLSRGAVRIAGHDLFRTPLEAKRALSFFSDEPRLFEFLSVQQHLEFVARIYQVTDGGERSRQLLQDLELAEVAAQLPAQLSRGMKQKVALACGFLHQPRAMFFDEPLTGLDPMAIRRTKDLIRQQAAAGVAIVISSHLLHLLEEVCSHVLVLKKGRTVSYDTLDRIRQSADGETLSLEEIFIRLVGEDANS